MECSRKTGTAVFHRHVRRFGASCNEVADRLGVDARGEDDVGPKTPEAVRTCDSADICPRPQPDEAGLHALKAESFEVRAPMAKRGEVRLEAPRLELRQQQSKLPLAAADAERGAKKKDSCQRVASS